MHAVVDTNILIHALIKLQGTVGPVLGRLVAGDYTLIYAAPLGDELLAKLILPRMRQKYHITDEAVEQTLAVIALRGELVRSTRSVRVCRDPKDNMLIEAALAAQAEYIVTGAEDLLVLKTFESAQMVGPRTFLKVL